MAIPNIPPLILQTGVTFLAATLGSIIGAFLTLRVNRSKHLQELRSAAYVDFLRGLVKVAIARKDPLPNEHSFREELDGVMLLADAKARIGIYGSSEVVRSVAQFVSQGSQTFTQEGMDALTGVCGLMRKETNSKSVPVDDLSRMLFNSPAPARGRSGSASYQEPLTGGICLRKERLNPMQL